jgi:hypothetical protein
MPRPGHFILHASATPPLTAGDYVLEGTQALTGGSIEPYRGHVRVTSPRYRLPPDQLLSTYPPANAEGAFEARLPQVVLRRRTLPWERQVAPGDTAHPWLALVVIAEGEGQLSAESDVKDCVTPGTTLDGPNDVARGVYLAVSRTVVDKVFPTADDLPLLAHVREVDVNDTELAMGDDDGFLAVVMANRLPQFDRATCQPVRYMACLINLEGQLGALPPAVPPLPQFDAVVHVQDLRALGKATLDTDQFAMGTVDIDASALLTLRPDGSGRRTDVRTVQQPPEQRSATSDSWRTTQTTIGQVAVSATANEAARVVREEMKAGFRFPVEALVREPVCRFPVLAYWSFTCTGAGSFETLMQGLDVGLLGTLPADPAAPPRPDCIPEGAGTAPPPAPPTRPEPEATETGHIGLRHVTRRGDDLRAWYRGPFTLHVTERTEPAPGTTLPLAHTSDHLRRVVPDGREDLGLAAAFEIGRLLALSQPSVVAALARWRREHFGAARARALAEKAAEGVAMLGPAFKGTIQELGQLAGRQLVLESAKKTEKVLARKRPLADPGRPIEILTGDVDRIAADGLGFSLDAVRTNADVLGVVAALSKQEVPVVKTRFSEAATLGDGLTLVVDQLTEGATRRVGPPGFAGIAESSAPGANQPARDALDELIDAAAGPDDEEGR